MDDLDMVSTTAPVTVAQTEENTMAPHEQPVHIETPKPKKKRSRLTPRQRAAKIAAGWNPPGPRPQTSAAVPADFQAAVQGTLIENKAKQVLKTLVDKLVSLENDPQYRSVWTHFFMHGGVYTGPKYIDELNDAIQYLIGTESAKISMGK